MQLPEVLADAVNVLSAVIRKLLSTLHEELLDLEVRVDAISRRIYAWANKSDLARKFQTIPGMGPLNSIALIAAVGDCRQFRRARDLSAWLGLVPKQFSTGGRSNLGGI